MTIQPQHSGNPYAGNYYGRPPAVTDQKRGNSGEIACAWVITVLTLGYMLPWAVAASRGKSNSAAVALLNFFAGWTVIGWIAALVLACTAHQPTHQPMMVVAPAITAPPPGWYADPHVPGGTAQRYWDGRVWTEHTHG